MFTKEIKASEGCILFFPERMSNGRAPIYISGPDRARRRHGEEWLQIKINTIKIDIRRENPPAVLQHGFLCNITAHVRAQIDDVDLGASLSKIITKFKCATSTAAARQYDERYFEPQLAGKCENLVDNVISKASYEQLLESDDHRDTLQSLFETQVCNELATYGLAVKFCQIRFQPIRPDGSLIGPQLEQIARKWKAWELAQHRFDAETKDAKEEIDTEIQRRRDDLGRLRIEEERVKLKTFEENRRKWELEKEKADKALEKEKSVIGEQLQEFYALQRAAKAARDHASNLKDKEMEDEVLRRQEELKRDRQREQLKSDTEDQERQLASIDKRIQLLQKEVEVSSLEKQIALFKTEVDSAMIAAKYVGEQTALRESAKSQRELVETILRGLPEVCKQLPRSVNDSDTVNVNLNTPNQSNTSIGWSMVGMALLPILKNLIFSVEKVINHSPSERSDQTGNQTPMSIGPTHPGK